MDFSFLSRSELERMERELVGKRVRLVQCDDPWTKLEPGSLGTVDGIDSAGTVQVKWDSGSRLGMVRGIDKYEVVS